ncbi:hypothetical protein C8246_04555 [Paracidovorax avenae]|uniref:tyrosine-type recombinase/integrase n=1 Tax=Paracidovorax avenae TaxID=80867 RepID=UPI000D169F89|nr:hypothetical protein C8246_04555 [Paracidovorax avenae]AVT05883.1 hypothetical protein C8248_07825 [Paracidovorax avenae]AVT20197.1 hypothetical protein C7Y68_09405 [Paracidovorax avenae]
MALGVASRRNRCGIRPVPDTSFERGSRPSSRFLEALRLISGSKGARVFLNPRDGQPWKTDAQIRKTLWLPLCDRSEIDYRNPYQVRHTYASTLLTAGHNPWYVAAQLGHEDVQMVFRT